MIEFTRPCRCGAPAKRHPNYDLWFCDEHMAQFLKRQEANRRHKEKHPYRGAVKSRNIYARSVGAEGSFTEQEWLDLIAKYKYRCVRCKKKVPLTIDHVVPLSKGGSNYIANIQPLCAECNGYKMQRTKDYRP